jgi:uncharacterized protein
MDITPLMRPEQKIIQSYGAGFFRANGVIFRHPVLVHDDVVVEWDGANNPLILSEQIKALEGVIDIVLIGIGKEFSVLPPSKRAALKWSGMTIDVMDTASACRTFNVLTAEGRRVAAALIPV